MPRDFAHISNALPSLLILERGLSGRGICITTIIEMLTKDSRQNPGNGHAVRLATNHRDSLPQKT